MINELHFGTAGIPNSTAKPSTLNGVIRVHELGLNAMEIEFVRGVRMSVESALEVRRVSVELGVMLTVHAPYYINLLSPEDSKVEASIRRIVESARVGSKAGAWSLVFHPGYYGRLRSEECVERVRNILKKVIKELIDEGIKMWVRPEVMGGLAEFGSVEEIVAVTEGLDYALPCIDFAHIYARSLGKVNSYETFKNVLEYVESRLGSDALKNSHIHMSGIEYGERGEVKHTNLNESKINYVDLMRVLKDFKVVGVLISESPNLEDDALLMMQTYRGV